MIIGRRYISGQNPQVIEFLNKEKQVKEILKDLWDWILNKSDDPTLFSELGFWINMERDFFDTVWLAKHVRKTLEKSKGILQWERGLSKAILSFAEVAPQETLEILRLYLLEGCVHGTNLVYSLFVEEEWLKSFQILYDNPVTKDGIDTLVNSLIYKGESKFWKLKEIIKRQEINDK